jgi:N-acetylglucosaminyldiphosphoundecaprenol N-acetyl-beta-D-mannosaminyltransferase
MKSWVEVMVGGFPTACLTRRELAQVMVRDCLAARTDSAPKPPKLVFSSNGQGIAIAGQDPAFAKAMDEADIVHADGMPVVFASRLTHAPLPERIATTDFFHDAAAAAVDNGLSFFFLGASESQNAAAVETAKRLYPGLRVVGRHHGYFDKNESGAICEMVRASGAEVLWLGLGKPMQEHWAVAHRDQLTGVTWIKTCGGLFGFLSGEAKRAPEWMQKVGLEWLHRVLDNPGRLAWRYLTTNAYATYRLIRRTDFAERFRPRTDLPNA